MKAKIILLSASLILGAIGGRYLFPVVEQVTTTTTRNRVVWVTVDVEECDKLGGKMRYYTEQVLEGFQLGITSWECYEQEKILLSSQTTKE